MDAALKDKKVSEITIGELQDIIRQTLHEFLDPDYGLELRSEVEKDLEESLRQKERGEGIPLEVVRKQLGRAGRKKLDSAISDNAALK